MASSSTTTTTTESSLSDHEAVGPGKVSKLRQNWAVLEDGALAQRLQHQEIESHLGFNKRKNHQIREDFPAAFQEQQRELSEAEWQYREHVRRQRELEARDEELARQMALELERQEIEHKRYEATRDEVFARRIQALEKTSRQQRPAASIPMPGQEHEHQNPVRRKPPAKLPSSANSPPLASPTSDDLEQENSRDTSFHDLRGGLKYNDEQYLVKVARPAVVKDEPVYANNKPEHYAVSNPFPGGDFESTPNRSGAISTHDLSPELLGAAGLSQKDLVVSKRVEAQLEQERKDQELARRLQEALNQDEDESQKAEREARDMEYARLLHEKEKAKLKRAKERSRLKKELERQRLQQEQAEDLESEETRPPQDVQRYNAKSPNPSAEAEHHRRTNSNLSNKSKSPELYAVPARKAIMNPEAIDSHVSSCGEDVPEPYYENLNKNQVDSDEISSQTETHPRKPIAMNEAKKDTPVPPYMPMQHANSKRMTSLERRINKKKEKEGCKQQ